MGLDFIKRVYFSKKNRVAFVIFSSVKCFKKYFCKKKYKLIMTLLVRDEKDIIEKNIDFHLKQGVDFIVATDNGSVDGTLEVLKEYEKKGTLFLIEEPQQDYSQAEWVNRMGRLACEKYNADIVFHCDADEFWCSKSGNLKNEINKKDNVDVLRVDLANVLLEEKNGQENFPADNKWAVVKPYETKNLEEDSRGRSLYLLKYPPKVIYKTDKGYIDVTQGNHDIVAKERLTIDDSGDIIIYHFPIRSKNHFFQKIKNGGSAYEANKKFGKEVGFHWRRWFDSYKNGKLEEEYKKLVLNKIKATNLENDGVVEKFDFKNIT